MTEEAKPKKKAKKKEQSETDLIECEIVRNCYYGKPGEKAMIERQYVRVMQKAGSVRIAL